MERLLIHQIKSELAFLHSQAIKHLVHEADIGAAHYKSPTIEARKIKLKALLKKVQKR
ncbi:hypothetical protein LCGC14_2051880 [marine sediment metagenome]|uniref:Uncharacterized protein n=1 Tax=marine sediment metagenome TaxID=412755 RepID=A0A0F9H277_9ZZZZ